MKTSHNTQTIESSQPAELKVITPELGLLVITGSFEDVLEAQKTFDRTEHPKVLSASAFEAAVQGRGVGHKQWLRFGLHLVS